MSGIHITGAQAAEMSAHLSQAYPEEGCGVLLGRESRNLRVVHELVAFPNQREDSRHNRYLIAPEQFLAAEKRARERTLDVVGIYHSHPDHPAEPSQFDLDHAWPYYSYVIVSVQQGEVADARSWRLKEDRSRFDSEPLVIAGHGAIPDPRRFTHHGAEEEPL